MHTVTPYVDVNDGQPKPMSHNMSGQNTIDPEELEELHSRNGTQRYGQTKNKHTIREVKVIAADPICELKR